MTLTNGVDIPGLAMFLVHVPGVLLWLVLNILYFACQMFYREKQLDAKWERTYEAMVMAAHKRKPHIPIWQLCVWGLEGTEKETNGK